jgi:hypothetical protein
LIWDPYILNRPICPVQNPTIITLVPASGDVSLELELQVEMLDRQTMGAGMTPEMRCHILFCKSGFSWESEVDLA